MTPQAETSSDLWHGLEERPAVWPGSVFIVPTERFLFKAGSGGEAQPGEALAGLSCLASGPCPWSCPCEHGSRAQLLSHAGPAARDREDQESTS